MTLGIAFGVTEASWSKIWASSCQEGKLTLQGLFVLTYKKLALKCLLTREVHHVPCRVRCMQHRTSDICRKGREFLPVRKPEGQLLVGMDEVRM